MAMTMSSETRLPLSMMVLACCPNGVLAVISARRRSPVERWLRL